MIAKLRLQELKGGHAPESHRKVMAYLEEQQRALSMSLTARMEGSMSWTAADIELPSRAREEAAAVAMCLVQARARPMSTDDCDEGFGPTMQAEMEEESE